MVTNLIALRQTAINAFTHMQSISLEQRKYMAGIILFPYFCLTDGVLTKILLQKGGTEVNPIVEYCIHTLGVNSIFMLKMLGIVLVIASIEFIRRKGRVQTSKRLLNFAVLTYGFVCTFLLSEALLVFILR